MLQKVVSISTGLISVPITLRYLGNEQFGIWMAFTGLVTFFQFTDLGLGIGLQNHLTTCDGTDDRVRPRRLISVTLAVMVFTAALLILAALFVIPALPLERIIRTTSEAARAQLLPCARMFIIAFAIVLPFGLVPYVCNAYQRSYVTNGCFASINLIAFAGILIGIGAHLPLWWFIFVATIAPALVYLLVGAAILHRKPWLRPTFHSLRISELRTVMSLGLPAFGAQVGVTLMSQGPTLVIVSLLGAAALVPVALSQRLLSVSIMLLPVLMLPLWPAYGEAAARRDIGWIKRTFVRSLWLSLLVVGSTSVLVAIFGRTVILLWTNRPEIVPSLSLLIACSTWASIVACTSACCMLLNGLGRMTGQAIYGSLLPVITIALSFQLASTVGAAGVVWITILFGEAVRAAFVGAEVFIAFRALGSCE
jgi:O-antigen/teichoic acid export membrane protein